MLNGIRGSPQPKNKQIFGLVSNIWCFGRLLAHIRSLAVLKKNEIQNAGGADNRRNSE